MEAIAGSIMEVNQYLDLVDGADLHLEGLNVSHCVLILRATKSPIESPYISFAEPEYLDCAECMHNVRLRLATVQETEELRRKLPAQRARWLLQRDHLIIHCEEGTCEIWARGISLTWKEKVEGTFIKSISGPLWPGGPSLDEL